MEDKIAKVLKLLGVKEKLLPKYWNADFFELSVRCEFEAFGKASENFDEVWVLKLPNTQYYFRLSDGAYREGTKNLSMSFKGKTMAEVLDRAIDFLENCPQAIK